MKPGALNKRVTLESLTEQRTATGSIVKEWAAVATVRANIAPKSARELAAASGRYQETTHTVTIRFYPGVTNEMRIVYGSRIFEILSPLNMKERNQWLSLECREVS